MQNDLVIWDKGCGRKLNRLNVTNKKKTLKQKEETV